MYYYSEKAITDIIKISDIELENIILNNEKKLKNYFKLTNNERKWSFKGILILRRLKTGKIIKFPQKNNIKINKNIKTTDVKNIISGLEKRIKILENIILNKNVSKKNSVLKKFIFSKEISF